ncbi:hypothetical protein [Intestinimonas butyriciproducens]|uniref:hypothetical protein n=1 Tax=Intestinimonas butyriciproducens TaxID=1297617 RepID=UPI001FBBE92B|nr:hypothetical protein [Intestinimonas butyriciproducens]
MDTSYPGRIEHDPIIAQELCPLSAPTRRAHLAPRSVHHARIHAVVLCGHRGEADAIRTCGTLRAGVSGVTFWPLRALWPRLALDAL